MRGGTSGEWNVTQLPQGEITFRSIEFTETSERIGEMVLRKNEEEFASTSTQLKFFTIYSLF